jgi:hypothetical protein
MRPTFPALRASGGRRYPFPRNLHVFSTSAPSTALSFPLFSLSSRRMALHPLTQTGKIRLVSAAEHKKPTGDDHEPTIDTLGGLELWRRGSRALRSCHSDGGCGDPVTATGARCPFRAIHHRRSLQRRGPRWIWMERRRHPTPQIQVSLFITKTMQKTKEYDHEHAEHPDRGDRL